MGLFNRGQAASALILDGKRAVRAYLGDQLVWDGTMDAFVPIPHILVSATMADPVVAATALAVAPFITASAQVHEPSVSGTATVRPETAILVTGAVYVPDVSADALIEVPAISVSAIVLAPTVSEAFDATVEAPSIQVTAGMYSPKITADYAATVPIIAAFAELLAPLVTATGTAVVNAPMIAVSGSVNAPTVIGSSSVAVPAIVASATVYAPEVRRDAKVLAPLIAGSSTLYAPVVQALNGPTVSAYTTFSKTTGSAVTITLPAANVGDLWVIAMGTVSGQMGSTPSGWTKRLGNGSWNDTSIEVWTRTKVAGDPATITTAASGFTNDIPAEVIAMTVTNQTGVNASSSVSASTSTSTTPHPTPAITTTVAKTVLIRMVSTGPQTAAHTWPAGVTPVTSVINGSSGALSVAVQTADVSGSQPIVNATPSNGSKYSSGTIAISPT